MVISLAIDTLNYYSKYLSNIEAILCMVLSVLAFCFALMIALSFHEMAHAFAAKKNGDFTAKYAGRLTPNPFKHFDPIGIVMMFLVGFGWAKPVPIDPNNFENRKKGMIETSIAGVATNIIFAIFFSLLYSFFLLLPAPVDYNAWFYIYLILNYFLFYGIIFNINFFLFNLIPLSPLDGFRLLETLFPSSRIVEFLRRYGGIILIGLILFGYATERIVGMDLSPITLYISNVGNWLFNTLMSFWGLFGL